jgi:signal transduction histidine kinase
VVAHQLGSEGGDHERPLRVGPIDDESGLEIVEGEVGGSDRMSWSLAPRAPGLAVRPTQSALAAIESRLARRRIMVIGESALLFALLAVCLVMLYRLAVQDIRNLRRMEEFVSAFTHEIKTPLAGVKSLLQTLAAGRVPEGRRDELIALGLEQTERLGHSIDNVLLSGSLRAGRYQLEVDAVRLRPLLEGIVEHHQRADQARDEGLLLEWKSSAEDLTVVADEGALRIIVENLVDNGLKYGGEGPVTVRVRRRAPRVEIAVEDRGAEPGLELADVERLFLPFERGGGEDSRTPGTGLGLYIAKTLARRMGGDVTGASRHGGCVFTVTLREAVDVHGDTVDDDARPSRGDRR